MHFFFCSSVPCSFGFSTEMEVIWKGHTKDMKLKDSFRLIRRSQTKNKICHILLRWSWYPTGFISAIDSILDMGRNTLIFYIVLHDWLQFKWSLQTDQYRNTTANIHTNRHTYENHYSLNIADASRSEMM